MTQPPTAPLPPLKVAQALATARASGLDHLESQWLVGHLLKQSRSWLLTHDDTLLAPVQQVALHTLCARRQAGEPLAYLLGEWEFHGHRLQVTPDVLIPRPDTETLVDWAIELLQQAPPHPAPQVVDLGTGSGAIAVSVALAVPTAQVWATDISEAALAVARTNCLRHAPRIVTAQGSWWRAVETDQRFDLALANPPYIAEDDTHLAQLTFEPRGALTPEGDGLDAIRQIAADAPRYLRPGAWLLLEHGWDQAEPVTALLRSAGFRTLETRRDLAGRARCTGAQR